MSLIDLGRWICTNLLPLDDSHTLLLISAGLQDLSPWEVVRIYGRNLEHRLVGNAFEIGDCELALCIVLNLVPEYIVGLQMCVYDVLRFTRNIIYVISDMIKIYFT